MRVTEITVTAGRTFNHPHESYSNLRPSVTMTASLDEHEDAREATKHLQAKAEQLVEDHKNHLLETLEEIYEQNEIDNQISDLERQLTSAQQRLDHLRKQRELPPGIVERMTNDGSIGTGPDRSGEPRYETTSEA
jgi:hypothetical protein